MTVWYFRKKLNLGRHIATVIHFYHSQRAHFLWPTSEVVLNVEKVVIYYTLKIMHFSLSDPPPFPPSEAYILTFCTLVKNAKVDNP